MLKDEEFFGRVDTIRKKMYRIAYSYMNSESMAIDMVDEAVYKGYLKKKQLKEEAFFETWMIRILMNLCATQYKKSQREVQLPESMEWSDETEFENLDLKEAIAKLPEQYRQLVILKYFGGYSTKEMADLLDIPMGTVGTRISKALSILRVDLEG